MLRIDIRLEEIRDRLEVLEAEIGQVREDPQSLLYAERNFGVPWRNIYARVERSRREMNDAHLLEAVTTAMVHLENKNHLTLIDGRCAYSQAAMQMDALSGAPGIGSLFSSSSNLFRNEGMRKQINRLDAIERWVGELEARHPVPILRRLLR